MTRFAFNSGQQSNSVGFIRKALDTPASKTSWKTTEGGDKDSHTHLTRVARLKQSASKVKTTIDLPGVAPMLISASFATAGEKI